jgi:hypothetical protein
MTAENRQTEGDAAAEANDPGRRATPEEASKAWAEVIDVLRKIEPWNLPKAADYVRSDPPTAEAIALGFFAVEILKRREFERYGQKGGRKSKKPMNIDLLKKYDTYRAALGSDREARSKLVNELKETLQVSATTVRGWLRKAGI